VADAWCGVLALGICRPTAAYNVLAAAFKRTEPCKRQQPSLSGPFTLERRSGIVVQWP